MVVAAARVGDARVEKLSVKIKKTVSFFGKGNTKVTTPFGQKTQIIKHCNPCLGKLCKKENKEISCIKKISQKNVENAVTKLIEQ